ncbi:MAG: hypothetical protein PVI75_05580 [Gammaproteobacteria bacterium]|jgi:alpha-tubulin suppressor-like RCC1 family protein
MLTKPNKKKKRKKKNLMPLLLYVADSFSIIAQYLITREKLNLVKAFSPNFKNYSFLVVEFDSFELLKKRLKDIKKINQNFVVFLLTPLGNYGDCFFIRGVKKKVFCSEDSKYISALRGLDGIEVCVISKNHKCTEKNVEQVISASPNNFPINKTNCYLLFLAQCINEIIKNYDCSTKIDGEDADKLIEKIRIANESIYKKKEKNHIYIRVSGNTSYVFGIVDVFKKIIAPEMILNLSPLFILYKFSYALTLMSNEKEAHGYINNRKKKKGLEVAVYSKNGELWFIANNNFAKKKLELQPKHKDKVKKIIGKPTANGEGVFPIKMFELNKLKKILNTYPAFTFHIGASRILTQNQNKLFVPHNRLNKISSENGGIAEFHTGKSFVFIKTKNNKWFCWGDNQFGELGLGHSQEVNNPVPHNRLNEISSKNGGIAEFHTGENFVFIKTKNNKWFCWGGNWRGELGFGHSQKVNNPVPHNRLNEISSKNDVHTGENSVFIKTKNNKWFCWGYNQFGELGLGHSQEVNNSVSHDRLNEISSKNGGIVEFHTGENFVFIKTKNNKWFCWGYNQFGELGLGHSQKVNNPVPHNRLNEISSKNGGIVEFHVGKNCVFIKTKNNKFFYWGTDRFMEMNGLKRGLSIHGEKNKPTLLFSGQKNLEEKIKKLMREAKEPQDKGQIRKLLRMMNKQKIVESDPNERIIAMREIEVRYNSYNKRLMGNKFG